MEHRGWQHALFRGGVPGNQRPARLDRFRSDEKYRAFLSTDAGGVGLNLQHAASVVVTLDLSWNPAVLEQRIDWRSPVGPVARFRSSISSPKAPSRRACRRIAFHKSLFTSALDSGQPEVFLGSSRLNKFVGTVALIEQPITRTIPHADSLTAAYTHNCEALVVVSVSSVAEPTSSKAR